MTGRSYIQACIAGRLIIIICLFPRILFSFNPLHASLLLRQRGLQLLQVYTPFLQWVAALFSVASRSRSLGLMRAISDHVAQQTVPTRSFHAASQAIPVYPIAYASIPNHSPTRPHFTRQDAPVPNFPQMSVLSDAVCTPNL